MVTPELEQAFEIGASAIAAGLLLGLALFVVTLFNGSDSTRGGD